MLRGSNSPLELWKCDYYISILDTEKIFSINSSFELFNKQCYDKEADLTLSMHL